MLPLCRRRAGSLRVVCSELLIVGLTILIATAAFGQKTINRPRKVRKPNATPTPGEQSLTNLPIPVGREMKGLVLPDYDAEGHLIGRFEAGSAVRLDEERIRFGNLKITTYTPDNQVDLQIEMPSSIFQLRSKTLTSGERTTIRRTDFNITGDTVAFDANARTSRLTGNVKMVITNASQLMNKPDQ